MKKQSPERLSFHEIRSIINSFNAGDERIRLIGNDFAMLHNGRKLLHEILQTDTPYIMEDYRVAFVKRGNIKLTVNLIEHEYGEGTFAFIATGCILQVSSMSEDFDVCGMMINNERMNAALGAALPTPCNDNALFFTIHPQPGDAVTIMQMFGTAWQLSGTERFPDETLNGMIYAIIHYFTYLKSIETDTEKSGTSRKKELFNIFIGLVNANARHEHKLQFYADKMCITPRYLSTTIKQVSGINAKEWIDRAIVTNAKVMLRYSSKQVAEIADTLNFPNASFFCKFFKHATGQTPQEYRGKRS